MISPYFEFSAEEIMAEMIAESDYCQQLSFGGAVASFCPIQCKASIGYGDHDTLLLLHEFRSNGMVGGVGVETERAFSGRDSQHGG